MKRQRLTPIERLRRRIVVDPITGCHNWQGSRTKDGYGQIKIDGFVCYTHRVIYALFVADLRAGWHVDHLCRNRACCNPDHLEQVTPEENARRGSSAVLDAAVVAVIRTRIAGGESLSAIARSYKVGHSAIARIRDGVTWRGVAASAA